MRPERIFPLIVSLVVVAGAGKGSSIGGLRENFYRTTGCPQAEQLVRQITWSKARNDPTLGAKLLRMHYHDCFVRGCDASILLDTIGTNQSEKDARPNLTLGRFKAIDDIKSQIERVCPGIVSCADILALAARDAVSFPFKRPMWDVLTGRRDGRVSLISDVSGNLPSPFSDFQTLQTLFEKKSLNINDLVALSEFPNRLFNSAIPFGIDKNSGVTGVPTFIARLYQEEFWVRICDNEYRGRN
ncbi:unnamed protein product [Fraxinus pennsylvanica]|uniref:peroxidase n=1 Tax=Fraxinus pennsylvanica TaxID=56036 RepID=A0AAD1ZJN9_9LAMI|nr:unnamed protein product [Fraxinus pennsylvanica]